MWIRIRNEIIKKKNRTKEDDGNEEREKGRTEKSDKIK